MKTTHILLLCSTQLWAQTSPGLQVSKPLEYFDGSMGPTFLPLKYHSQYDPRQERATLLSLADLSSGSGSNQTSSYSYLISLGQGDNLPSIDNLLRQHNPEQEVDITTGNKIVSPLTW